jgi:putative oxidoreductase
MAQLDIESRLEAVAPLVLSVFRIVIGFLFACHGAAVLFGWPITMKTGTPAFGTWPLWYAGAIELVVGVLVAVGPIANGGEPATLFCFAFFLLVFTGGGIIALDTVRRR